jgi:hypothetical protein
VYRHTRFIHFLRNFFPSQNVRPLSRLALSGCLLSYILGSCSINCTKTKLQTSSAFRAILTNKWIIKERYRTADTRKSRGNVVVRRLACSVAWKMSFSVFPRVALPFPQISLLHSVTCVQLGLITVLGNRSCQFPWCKVGLTEPAINNCDCSWRKYLTEDHLTFARVYYAIGNCMYLTFCDETVLQNDIWGLFNWVHQNQRKKGRDAFGLSNYAWGNFKISHWRTQ